MSAFFIVRKERTDAYLRRNIFDGKNNYCTFARQTQFLSILYRLYRQYFFYNEKKDNFFTILNPLHGPFAVVMH